MQRRNDTTAQVRKTDIVSLRVVVKWRLTQIIGSKRARRTDNEIETFGSSGT